MYGRGRLELRRELVPMHRREDQHGVAGVDLRDQRGEIILLDAVRRMLALAAVAGKTCPHVLFPDAEGRDIGLPFQLLRKPLLQRVGVAVSPLARVDNQDLLHNTYLQKAVIGLLTTRSITHACCNVNTYIEIFSMM